MHYRTFGTSGLRVSELFLGAMTFGEQGGAGAHPQECRRILDAYANAGGNVIDTAINYRDSDGDQAEPPTQWRSNSGRVGRASQCSLSRNSCSTRRLRLN